MRGRGECEHIIHPHGTLLLGGYDTAQDRLEVKMSQALVSFPVIRESDSNTLEKPFPNDARLRNLTYASRLEVIFVKTLYRDEVATESTERVEIGKVSVLLPRRGLYVFGAVCFFEVVAVGSVFQDAMCL